MARHVPGATCPARPIGTYPQQYVDTESESEIRLTFAWSPDEEVMPPGKALAVTISRKDARMLARRINQCLDATRSKNTR